MQHVQQGQSPKPHDHQTHYQRQRQRQRLRRITSLSILAVAVWYVVFSEASLLTKVLAANIVATPAEARGTPLNDDGTPFLSLAEDSVQQRRGQADKTHKADKADSAGGESGEGVVRYSDGNITIRQRSSTPSSSVPSVRVPSATAFDAPAAQVSGAPNAFVVRLVTKHSLWVRVRRDDAAQSRDYMLKAGQQREWTANMNIRLSLGHTRGVRLVLNGKPYSIAPKPDRVIRNLLLSSTSLAVESLQ
jgi:hypothetical protein